MDISLCKKCKKTYNTFFNPPNCLCGKQYLEKRIDDNTYGYCEETGDPINVKRLAARPVATLSLEAQEMHEKKEKIKIKGQYN